MTPVEQWEPVVSQKLAPGIPQESQAALSHHVRQISRQLNSSSTRGDVLAACAAWHRRMHPLRTRLYDRVRYLLSHHPTFSVWTTAAGDHACGLKTSEGQEALEAIEPPDLTSLPPEFAKPLESWAPQEWVAALQGLLNHYRAALDLDAFVDVLSSLIYAGKEPPVPGFSFATDWLDCPGYDTLEAHVDERVTPNEIAWLTQHERECRFCAGHAASLRNFARGLLDAGVIPAPLKPKAKPDLIGSLQRKLPPWMQREEGSKMGHWYYLVSVAAVVWGLLLAAWPQKPKDDDSKKPINVTFNLAAVPGGAGEKRSINIVIQNAKGVKDLIAGNTEQKGFKVAMEDEGPDPKKKEAVVEPAKPIRVARPWFTWIPVNGATEYEVRLYLVTGPDQSVEVETSGRINRQSWQPVAYLKAAANYRWKVQAYANGQEFQSAKASVPSENFKTAFNLSRKTETLP